MNLKKNLKSYQFFKYRQTSNINCTLICNNIVDHTDVVGAGPTGDIFILDLTPGFNGLDKDNCKTVLETF